MGNSLKSHPTDWEKQGIEPATPGLQDIGLSPTFAGLSVPPHLVLMSVPINIDTKRLGLSNLYCKGSKGQNHQIMV